MSAKPMDPIALAGQATPGRWRGDIRPRTKPRDRRTLFQRLPATQGYHRHVQFGRELVDRQVVIEQPRCRRVGHGDGHGLGALIAYRLGASRECR
jgi:hypothetical protein